MVSDTPSLVIGPDDGAPSGPLFQIGAAHRFADGSLIIANGGSHELRFYTSDGVLDYSVGGEGGGPREFGHLSWVRVAADSIWVNDRRNDRVSVLDRRGQFGRLIPIQSEAMESLVIAEGVFEDGSILLSRNDPSFTVEAGLKEVFDFLQVRRPDGETRELGRFFIGESYWQEVGGRFGDAGRPFGRRAVIETHGRLWFYTAGKQYRIEQYDQLGQLRGVFSYGGEPHPATKADLDAYLKRILGDREGPSQFEQMMRSAPLPERMPAYADLSIDQDGNVWGQVHGGAAAENCWHVYERERVRFARICLPERFRGLQIGDDWVLGVSTDDLDVERVVVLPLSKRR